MLWSTVRGQGECVLSVERRTKSITIADRYLLAACGAAALVPLLRAVAAASMRAYVQTNQAERWVPVRLYWLGETPPVTGYSTGIRLIKGGTGTLLDTVCHSAHAPERRRSHALRRCRRGGRRFGRILLVGFARRLHTAVRTGIGRPTAGPGTRLYIWYAVPSCMRRRSGSIIPPHPSWPQALSKACTMTSMTFGFSRFSST